MTHYAHLSLFFALVFGVVLLPGLDMALVLGSALTGGRPTGLAAVGGIVVGGVCHVVMTALGASVLLKFVPDAFNALLLAGALYIAWIGFALVRSKSVFSELPNSQNRLWRATFRRGTLTSLLNPKAHIFMLAIFPQFLRPEYGVLWIQVVTLWIIIAFTQLSVHGSVALMADRVRASMIENPVASVAATRCVGIVLIAGAIYTG